MNPETKIERELDRRVKAAGGRTIKLDASIYRGIPDRLVCLPNRRPIFCEVKTFDGRLRPAQLSWRKWLMDRGYEYVLYRRPEDLPI